MNAQTKYAVIHNDVTFKICESQEQAQIHKTVVDRIYSIQSGVTPLIHPSYKSDWNALIPVLNKTEIIALPPDSNLMGDITHALLDWDINATYEAVANIINFHFDNVQPRMVIAKFIGSSLAENPSWDALIGIIQKLKQVPGDDQHNHNLHLIHITIMDGKKEATYTAIFEAITYLNENKLT